MVSTAISYHEPRLRAVKYRGIEGPSPHNSKLVSVKKSALVKIGKFIKIGSCICSLFLLEEKICIGMLFTL